MKAAVAPTKSFPGTPFCSSHLFRLSSFVWDTMGRTDFRNSLRENTPGCLPAAGSNRNGLGVRWTPNLNLGYWTPLSLEPSSVIKDIYRFWRVGVKVKRKNVSKLPDLHSLSSSLENFPQSLSITQLFSFLQSTFSSWNYLGCWFVYSILVAAAAGMWIYKDWDLAWCIHCFMSHIYNRSRLNQHSSSN